MKNERRQVRITFEHGLRPKPEPHELWAAGIMAEHYNTDVIFLRRGIDKSADFRINGTVWELKSPRGNGERTIENNLREASHQSQNIIISLYRTKMRPERVVGRAKHYLQNEKNRHIKRLIIISKSGKMIDLL